MTFILRFIFFLILIIHVGDIYIHGYIDNGYFMLTVVRYKMPSSLIYNMMPIS